MTHKLYLLGVPTLQSPSGSLKLERKTAAVLAYVALEGPSQKYKLAGWLWPDSGETAARNNMRQLLRRLRVAMGEVVLGEDRIELNPEVEVDLKQLSYLESLPLDLLKQSAELLEGLDYDDTPDFAEWLASTREELDNLRAGSARGEALRLEARGSLKQALEYAQVWLRLEPLSEEAHRLVIRLYYLLGDRGAALSAFERCKKVLEEELGAEPLPETLELIRLIERGSELPGLKPKPKEPILPTAILRPPVLAGREREWALMEEAWQRRKIILISGEPGSGKTRLAEEFLATKGRFVRNDGRPGDVGVPYSTVTRNLRELLALRPELSPTSGHLEPWVWSELTRLMPELGQPTLLTDGAKLRLFQAISTLYDYCTRGLVAILADDVQFYDDSSHEAGSYNRSLDPDAPRYVGIFRKGELSPKAQELIGLMVEGGIVTLIELEPLDPEAIEAMLAGMGIHNPAHLVQGLSRYTGGNPLFITETLKHLIETDSLSQGLPSRLAPPGKVAALIGRRLGRLSPSGLNLARAAAVASSEFSLELASSVLERPAMELAEAHAELEASQIMRGNRFTHDLVFEAVLAGIPTAVKQVLHGRTAQRLEAIKANPALIAQHWLEAGDGDKAAHWLIQAASIASALGLYTDVVELLERAIQAAQSKALRLEAQVILADSLGPIGRVEESLQMAQATLREADNPRIKQRALSVLQNMYQGLGRYAEAEGFIEQALELAQQLGEHDRADGMRFAKARMLRYLGRYSEAIELLEAILPRYLSGPSVADLIQVLTSLGNTHNLLGQHAQAEPPLRQAFELSQEAVGPALRILAVSNLLYCLICQGNPEELLGESEAALALGNYAIGDHLRNNLALAYLRLGRLEEAITHYRVQAERAFDPNYRCIALARLAGIYAQQSPAKVAGVLEQALQIEAQAQSPAARFTLLEALLLCGSPEQKAWAKPRLQALDPAILPWLLLPDYERLWGEPVKRVG